MARAAHRRTPRATNIWPGFVDALATMLMVIIFLLMIFVLAQFFLNEALSGRDEALTRLNREIEELADVLSLEREANAQLRLSVAQLSAELQGSIATRDNLADEIDALKLTRDTLTGQLAAANKRAETLATATDKLDAELADAFKTVEAGKEKIDIQLAEIAKLRRDVATLTALRADLEADLARLRTKSKESESALTDQTRLTEAAQARIDLMTRQLSALRQQLARIATALEVAEAKVEAQQTQIANLGKRLNLALASKVEELSRYRSEFFGKLRRILGERPDIQVVGDRFILQSEVLFASGSAKIGGDGRRQMARLAGALKEIAAKVPSDIDWVLRVDGHTDRRPIATAQFPSNWELSTSRAISVVKYLVSQGIPPHRLVAAGFGEFQPLDRRADEIAFRRNRRIELKLTQR